MSTACKGVKIPLVCWSFSGEVLFNQTRTFHFNCLLKHAYAKKKNSCRYRVISSFDTFSVLPLILIFGVASSEISEMSSSKRRRLEDDSSKRPNVNDTLPQTLEKIAKLTQLVYDTLCHNTYSPIIFSFFDLRYFLSNFIFISKYHRNLLLSRKSHSILLCRTLAFYDFGTFITNPSIRPFFTGQFIRDGHHFIHVLYKDLPNYLKERKESQLRAFQEAKEKEKEKSNSQISSTSTTKAKSSPKRSISPVEESFHHEHKKYVGEFLFLVVLLFEVGGSFVCAWRA